MDSSTLFNHYLTAYESKNIDAIADLFDDDIRLRDWKISVSGRDIALEETAKNFAAADSLAIEIIRQYKAENTVIGELKITVNQTEILFVTDIITFNNSNKITSIRAYLGRDD